jgi:hypothetical protein
MAQKFAKGDRVSFVGDPATGDEATGTVMQFIAGIFNQYEIHTDRGGVIHLKEDQLEAAPAGKSRSAKN